jgi:hypothetical protein
MYLAPVGGIPCAEKIFWRGSPKVEPKFYFRNFRKFAAAKRDDLRGEDERLSRGGRRQLQKNTRKSEGAPLGRGRSSNMSITGFFWRGVFSPAPRSVSDGSKFGHHNAAHMIRIYVECRPISYRFSGMILVSLVHYNNRPIYTSDLRSTTCIGCMYKVHDARLLRLQIQFLCRLLSIRQRIPVVETRISLFQGRRFPFMPSFSCWLYGGWEGTKSQNVLNGESERSIKN